MLPNLSFKKCLRQCALRSSCEVMGYFRAALLCELHFIRDFWDTLACNESGPRVMVYVQRSDILLKDAETCKSCGILTSQTCGHCVTNECPPYAKVPNGTILGNLHSDGTKRLLKCDNGYAPKNRAHVQSVCKDGQWTKITQCVQEECVQNQTNLGDSTYTFYMKSHQTYNDSVKLCKKCGYRVVTIESQEEHTFLASQMKIHVPTPRSSYNARGDNDGFFLDFYNPEGNQTIRMDNFSIVLFTNFAFGQPNYLNQHFIAAMGYDNWLWHDVTEWDKFQTVCESEI
ncbi:uncharacterized protein LOC127835425 [Dreissena polymorpha]|uniref:C-type lectin domain-containing protein n=1 Tax=Dreissena polymorpha TaxID=45954 RepID=A0A9D4G3G7_DREPO|nr:uncharacterized protein LOC127835425 [Dreissena polymorpha]KAH3808409.1 hypothetical protein DPMN_136762 [Dreissena polymorpha]